MTKVFSGIVSSCGNRILYRTNNREFYRLMKNSFWAPKYIPDYGFLDVQDGYEFAVDVFDRRKKSVTINEGAISIKGNADKDIALLDNVFISLQINEILNQRRGRYSVHSSAVSKNRTGIVFYGDKGSGKTTLALSMSARYNYNFLSNDSTVIGAENIIGGTKIVTCKLGLIRENCPELEAEAETQNDWMKLISDYDDTNDDPWEKLVVIDVNKTKLVKSSQEQVTLGYIVFPLVKAGKRIRIRELRPWDIKLALYKSSTELIRGCDLFLFNHQEPAFDFDTPEIGLKRVENIDKTSKNVKGYYLEGDPSEISEFIDRLPT